MDGMGNVKYFLASTSILMCSNAFHLTVWSAYNQTDELTLTSHLSHTCLTSLMCHKPRLYLCKKALVHVLVVFLKKVGEIRTGVSQN